MASISLLTFSDVVEHVRSILGSNASTDVTRDARRAIINAYDEFAAARRWTYYIGRGRVNTVAPYSTGTITYTHSTRTLTLASGTWPTWASYGVVLIASVPYEVASRTSDSVLILSVNSNPGANVAAGTTYTIYRDKYPMPADFLAADQFMGLGTSIAYPKRVLPRDWLGPQQLNVTPATPRRYCVPVDHEILTKSGWKRHGQLVIGEDVLAYNNETGEMAWKPLLDKAVFDCDEDLLSIKRENCDFQFTNDHRWPVTTRKKTKKFVRGCELSDYHRIPLTGEFCGTESILPPRLAAILGWWVTDGYGLGKKDHWNAKISQSGYHHSEALLNLLGTKRRKERSDPDSDVWVYPIAKEDRWAIRRVIANKSELPSVVSKLSREAAEAMWQAMFDAEGCVAQTKPGIFQNHFFQCTEENRPVAEAFQILCLMTGKTMSLDKRKNSQSPAGYKNNSHWKYGGTIRKSKFITFKKGYMPEPVRYSGPVWCPQTEWGTWVMRHNGHVAITGNTFISDPSYLGTMAVAFQPPPDAAIPFEFVYHRRPRPLLVDEYKTGTITANSGSTQITGSGTAWASKHIGSTIRIGTAADYPTDAIGAHPFQEERTIMDVSSATVLTVDTAIGTDYSGVKYVISDPVDIEHGAMKVAFLRCVEKQASISRHMPTKFDFEAAYQKAFVMACEADSRGFEPRVARAGGNAEHYSLRDYPRGDDDA